MAMPHAKELGDLLPDWSTYLNPSVRLDYTNLQAAASALARAPERERRNVIAAYSWAYCDDDAPDIPKASGMYLLLRVLFVVPTRHPIGDVRKFSNWSQVVPGATEIDLSWPVHEDPSKHVLQIECFRPVWGAQYYALAEYDYFTERFPLRSADAIEALEIR